MTEKKPGGAGSTAAAGEVRKKLTTIASQDYTPAPSSKRLRPPPDEMVDTITGWETYADTITPGYRPGLTSAQVRDLQALGGKRQQRVSSDKSSNPLFVAILPRWSGEQMEFLRSVRPQNQICTVHVVREFEVKSVADRETLGPWIQPRLWQKHHGKRQAGGCEGDWGERTVYGHCARTISKHSKDGHCARTNSRSFVCYYDRRSKMTRRLVVRVEYRFTGSAACRAIGFETIDDALKADDRTWDAIFEREFCLREFKDRQAFEDYAMREIAWERQDCGLRSRLLLELHRLSLHGFHDFKEAPVQELVRVFGLDKQQWTVAIDPSAFLAISTPGPMININNWYNATPNGHFVNQFVTTGSTTRSPTI